MCVIPSPVFFTRVTMREIERKRLERRFRKKQKKKKEEGRHR